MSKIGSVDANGESTRSDEADDSHNPADDVAGKTRENATTAAPQETISNNHTKTFLQSTSLKTPTTKTTDVTDENSTRRGYILPLFVANMSLMILFYMMMMGYSHGVVRTLERRFSLRSYQTGLFLGANDVLHLCIVIFIGYFGRKGHKPRIISVTILFASGAWFMIASPHFLMSSTYEPDHSRLTNTTSETVNPFCLNWNKSGAAISGDQCDQVPSAMTESSYVHPAYYVFMIAQFIAGIGGSGLHTLSLAYIDENSPDSKSSFYIGIITSMYGFGPMCGMMLTAIALRLPENLLGPVKGSPSDATWIGCWWLGYVICATGILATSIPLWFFPKSCSEKASKRERQESAQRSKVTDENTLYLARKEIKEFPRRLLHLFRNKAYVVSMLSVVCSGYIVLGMFSNAVRYIEIHFLESAYVASLITGLALTLTSTVGTFSGGLIVSRLKIRPRGAVKIIICSEVVFITGIIIILLLGCPQLKMAGQMDPEEHRFTVITDCNKHCACPTNRMAYDPVCGSDNLTYFSACAAGCRNFVNGTYSECGCIGSGEGDSYGRGGVGAVGGVEGEGRIGEVGWAQHGLCRPSCNLLIPFAATMFLMTLLGSVAKVPSTMVNLRIVQEDDRAFALSINSFAINLFDKCGNDGFYYKDDNSFVICSNGNAYEQPCAPGSRNSGYDHYNHGNHYYYRDFCDVNLVDQGAGIPHGYGHQGAGYEYGRDGTYGKGHDSGYGYGHDAGYGHGLEAGY